MMCSDAPKKSSQFQAMKYVEAKTISSDSPKNLASFKYSNNVCASEYRSVITHQKI